RLWPEEARGILQLSEPVLLLERVHDADNPVQRVAGNLVGKCDHFFLRFLLAREPEPAFGVTHSYRQKDLVPLPDNGYFLESPSRFGRDVPFVRRGYFSHMLSFF